MHRKHKRQIVTSPTNRSDTTANIPQAVDVDSDTSSVNMDNTVDAEDLVMQHDDLPDNVNSNIPEAEDIWNYGDLSPPSSPSPDDDADFFNTNLTEDELDAPLPHPMYHPLNFSFKMIKSEVLLKDTRSHSYSIHITLSRRR